MGGRFLLFKFLILVFFVCFTNNAEGIGVNWGRQTTQKLQPATVVDMLLANGMDKVKFYSFNQGVMSAFSGSNISITIAVPNVEMDLIISPEKAYRWVQGNVSEYSKINKMTFRYVIIGSEPYTMINNRTLFEPEQYFNQTHVNKVEPCLSNVVQAFKKLGITDIKASFSFYTDVLDPSLKKPSEADFRDDVKEKVLKVLSHLNGSGYPIHLNIYPLNSIRDRKYPLEFAYLDDDYTFTVEDGNLSYTNVFDYEYDSFLCAMRKYNYVNVPIVVGQIGWPTDGEIYANISTAKRFYQGFFKRVDENGGTPLQPGPLDMYIYELVDENSKYMVTRGPTERHYGIYNYDGTPKFNVDFQGARGPMKKFEPAQGVSYMPRRWCIFDQSKKIDEEKRKVLMEETCAKADCSALARGASCGRLDANGNLSYAFNMFFQNRNQEILKGACNFQGFGKVINEDPSPNQNCTFPLQILSTIFVMGGSGEMGSVLPDAGESIHVSLTFTILSQLFVFFFGFLFM